MKKSIVMLVLVVGVIMMTTNNMIFATETNRVSVSLLGEIVSEGTPYLSVEYDSGSLYNFGFTYSQKEWDQNYDEFPPPYNESKGKITMWGGRIMRWLPNWNCPLLYGSSTVGILKPYMVLEINKITANTTYLKNEVLWQKNFCFGEELFFPERNLSLVVEVGIAEMEGFYITYNIGCKYYFELPFLKGGGK